MPIKANFKKYLTGIQKFQVLDFANWKTMRNFVAQKTNAKTKQTKITFKK